jgi:hypothetical protein
MYLIQRNTPAENNKPAYVNIPGSEKSYTTNPVTARRFPDYETALGHCCGNEHPVRRGDVLEY